MPVARIRFVSVLFMTILGIICLTMSLACFVGYALQRRRMAPIRVTMTSSVAHVRELAQAFAQFTSAKTFRQLVEVKGHVACAEPLVAPLSETACVYYSLRVSWEYEEIFYEEKPGGGRIAHEREAEEILAQEQRRQAFRVHDDSGEIALDPEGCEVIALNTLSRHEEDAGLPDETVRCGRFAMTAPWKTSAEERRPLRYHFEEEAIPVGSAIYVLAEATGTGGEVRLQKPAAGGRFLVSVKPEEDLLAAAQFAMWALLAGAIICGVIAAALLFTS